MFNGVRNWRHTNILVRLGKQEKISKHTISDSVSNYVLDSVSLLLSDKHSDVKS